MIAAVQKTQVGFFIEHGLVIAICQGIKLTVLMLRVFHLEKTLQQW
jgi:hypothetical protein